MARPDSIGLMTEQDWYSYLRISPDAETSEIEHAVERLSRQAAALETTAPERSRLLREHIRSIKRDLLSGPENRRRHDAARLRGRAQPGAPAGTTAPLTPPVLSQPSAGTPPASQPAATWHAATMATPPARPAGSGAGGRLLRFLRTGWTCPSCGNGAVPGDKFCTRCGTPIQVIQPGMADDRGPRLQSVCKACANHLAETDVFCSRCGTRC